MVQWHNSSCKPVDLQSLATVNPAGFVALKRTTEVWMVEGASGASRGRKERPQQYRLMSQSATCQGL